MPETIQVAVNGRVYTGWRRVRVNRSLDAASGSFALMTKPHEVQASGGDLPWEIKPGDRIEISLANPKALLLTGYVDQLEARLDAGTRALAVAGRDLTADLVDCAAPWEPGEHRNISLEGLARLVCKPFGIVPIVDLHEKPGIAVALSAVAGGSGGAAGDFVSKKFPVFRIDPGETSWSVIERACRLRGALAFADPTGTIRIEPPSDKVQSDPLREGQNLLAAFSRYRHESRFSSYTVLGQAAGDDETWGESAAHIKGYAEDPEILRHRPHVSLSHDPVTPDSANRLAEWDGAIRAARSSRVNVKVPGFRAFGSPDVWRVNRLVRAVIESVGVRGTLRVASVSLQLDENGAETTELGLARPDAYQPEPVLDVSAEPFSGVKGKGWSE